MKGENWLLAALSVYACYLIVTGWSKPKRYHVTCRIGLYTVCDFWTTNEAAVMEWKRGFHLEPDNPWAVDARLYNEKYGKVKQ